MPLFVYCNGVISVKRCSVVRKVTDFLSCSFFNDRTTSIAFMQFQKYFFLDLFSLISISSSQKQNKHYILGKNVYVDLIFSFCNIFVAWSFLGRIRFLILKTALLVFFFPLFVLPEGFSPFFQVFGFLWDFFTILLYLFLTLLRFFLSLIFVLLEGFWTLFLICHFLGFLYPILVSISCPCLHFFTFQIPHPLEMQNINILRLT